MSSTIAHLAKVYNGIIDACQQFRRNVNEIKLLAVSKQQSINKIVDAIQAGQLRFGENYIQEALPKIQYFHEDSLEWHFIGQIQSNKTRAIAENFAWVHTVASEKIVTRLASQRPAHMCPLNVCIEVNIDAEGSKGGVPPEKVYRLAKTILQYPTLQLRGLMVIPKRQDSFEHQRQSFAKCRQLLEATETALSYRLDSLSMGMSQDFRAAIAEGATIIRIGTAIFGPR